MQDTHRFIPQLSCTAIATQLHVCCPRCSAAAYLLFGAEKEKGDVRAREQSKEVLAMLWQTPAQAAQTLHALKEAKLR